MCLQDCDGVFLARIGSIINELLPNPAEIDALIQQHDLTLFLRETVAAAARAETQAPYCK